MQNATEDGHQCEGVAHGILHCNLDPCSNGIHECPNYNPFIRLGIYASSLSKQRTFATVATVIGVSVGLIVLALAMFLVVYYRRVSWIHNMMTLFRLRKRGEDEDMVPASDEIPVSNIRIQVDESNNEKFDRV